MRFDFRVLGPLEVLAPAGPVVVPGKRRRMLLLRLLAAANDVVPTCVLVEDVWDGCPPPGAASTLQSHASLLRKSLGDGRLAARDGGYVLSVDDDELESVVFEDEVRRGRQ